MLLDGKIDNVKVGEMFEEVEEERILNIINLKLKIKFLLNSYWNQQVKLHLIILIIIV